MKTTELLLFRIPKQEIDFYLSAYPMLLVVGSRITEDGYELLLEGSEEDLGALCYELEDKIELI